MNWKTLLLTMSLFSGSFAEPQPLFSQHMPGKSHKGKLPAATPEQLKLAQKLRADVVHLSSDIGNRNTARADKLLEAERWIHAQVTAAGYKVRRQPFRAAGHECANLDWELPGRERGVTVVGAHYDSAPGCPAANDNGSGVAVLLALSRHFHSHKPFKKTLRFVAFTNEEPPHFWTDTMGSLVYARACQQRKEPIEAMLALETLGYFSDEAGSQKYPPPLSLSYPSVGNFIGFVGDLNSGPLVQRCVGTFRKKAAFPSEGAALPGELQGVGWSDHWSFWQIGVPALMVTDTAPFRYPHYHEKSDTFDKLNYERLARVTEGLYGVVSDLAASGFQTR